MSYPESNATYSCASCGTLNYNQSKEFECVMEFPLSHFNVLFKAFPDMFHSISV